MKRLIIVTIFNHQYATQLPLRNSDRLKSVTFIRNVKILWLTLSSVRNLPIIREVGKNENSLRATT